MEGNLERIVRISLSELPGRLVSIGLKELDCSNWVNFCVWGRTSLEWIVIRTSQ
jgi:hypothetical protein